MTNSKIDIREAIRQGLENAKNAQIARKEIADCVACFQQNVEAFTNGKAWLTPQDGQGKQTRFPVVNSNRTYTSLTIEGLNGDKPFHVDVVTMASGPMGFPVSLNFGHQQIVCDFKEALMDAFGQLAATASFGRALLICLGEYEPTDVGAEGVD